MPSTETEDLFLYKSQKKNLHIPYTHLNLPLLESFSD